MTTPLGFNGGNFPNRGTITTWNDIFYSKIRCPPISYSSAEFTAYAQAVSPYLHRNTTILNDVAAIAIIDIWLHSS